MIGKKEEWCILCQGNGHTLASCEFIPEVKKLLVARAQRREEKRVIKKIKDEVTKEDFVNLQVRQTLLPQSPNISTLIYSLGAVHILRQRIPKVCEKVF